MDISLNGSKITALWLVTGKKIDTTRGYAIADKGFIVRNGEKTVLAITPTAIVAVECGFENMKEVDDIFKS